MRQKQDREPITVHPANILHEPLLKNRQKYFWVSIIIIFSIIVVVFLFCCLIVFSYVWQNF
jgi:hypothetical protein